MAQGLNREVAWNGVSVRVPKDWNLAAVSDEPGGGYMRMDDDLMPRVEIKWEKTRGTPDLARVKVRFMDQVRKGMKKSGAELEVLEVEEEAKAKGSRRRAEVVDFRWRAEVAAWARIQWCKKCGKVTVTQVFMPLEEERSALPARVLETVSDHSPDSWSAWSVYDFRFDSPEGFALQENHLFIGRLEFTFQQGEESLQFAQWGAADQRLEEKSVADWVRGEFKKELRGFEWEVTEAPRGQDEGALIEGRAKGIRTQIRAIGAALIKRETARLLRWWVWRCEETNRIYSVRGLVAPSHRDLVEEAVGRVVCA